MFEIFIQFVLSNNVCEFQLIRIIFRRAIGKKNSEIITMNVLKKIVKGVGADTIIKGQNLGNFYHFNVFKWTKSTCRENFSRLVEST